MSTETQTQAVDRNASRQVGQLFPEAAGSYFTQKIRRTTVTSSGSNLISETTRQNHILDGVVGALPKVIHGLETTEASVTNEPQYTVTFCYKPGYYVRATAYGKNAEVLREIVAQSVRERYVPSGQTTALAQPGEHGKIVGFNLTGVQRPPQSNGGRQNYDPNKIMANMSIIITELEVQYENDSVVEQRIFMPNLVGEAANADLDGSSDRAFIGF